MSGTRRRTALITGGSRGIGFGIAERLAREGYALAINGVRPEADVEGSLDELRALGAEVVYTPGDVGSDAGRRQMLERTL